ncbi:transglutaminase family protein [Roseiconus lacunae]|uniref:transglutaminase-like domain-containing protein n=1 Tax=Roseiconus lacunae TaxID=2605694 RepID=UPI003091664A|nr:transglutaminase family protein [Stieleria sp. HD01]
MMLIRVGFEISFRFSQPTALLALLNVHPSHASVIQTPDCFEVEPSTSITEFVDSFGNRCNRIFVPAGSVTLRNDTTVEDEGQSDPQAWNAVQHSVQDLPNEVLIFLLASRYCEVDSDLKDIAGNLFNSTAHGWHRVQSICNFVFQHLRFDYHKARANRTALEAFRERSGVCRDFTHLAIALCRCMNIPARYCTGYLGDIGVPPSPDPMDFCAWFEAYLGGEWYVFDPRNNEPRIGRVLMARGRDAADAALTTTFGVNHLESFKVWADEVRPAYQSGC